MNNYAEQMGRHVALASSGMPITLPGCGQRIWPATRHLHKMSLPALRQHVDAADSLAKDLWKHLEERSKMSAPIYKIQPKT